MAAKQFAPSVWVQGDSVFKGSVDANLKITPKDVVPGGIHKSHDLGMAMDLGITHYVNVGNQGFIGNVTSQGVQQMQMLDPGHWSNSDAASFVQAMINQPNRRQNLALEDFFSLYAITQKGANGSRDALASHIAGSANTDTVLNALFGDGSQKNGLINGVLIGGDVGEKNTYPDIRYALKQLGFNGGNYPTAHAMPSVTNVGPHYNHFHIYLQPPKLEPIHTNNLLLAAETSNVIVTDATADGFMLADVGAKSITPAIVRKIEKEFTNFCEPSENPSYVEGRNAFLGGLSPGYAVVNALNTRYGIMAKGEINTVITHPPLHGRVEIIAKVKPFYFAEPTEEFQYTPDKDFFGDDKVAFEVTINGQKFRISFVVRVVPGGFNDACDPKGNYDHGELKPDIQISLDEIVPLFDESNASDVAALDSWRREVALNAFFTYANNNITTIVEPLAGAAVGSTTGTTITLDDNASGYGWFIDTTPADNSEYLPTSTPNEWIAKAGSEAAGKMDMLSVLLHEYGHALGIEHSTDSNDYMAATLQPGVRRLPSTDELALMAQLVGETVGRVSTRQVGMNSDLPNTPANPGLPIGTALSALLIGRLRRTDYGSWSPIFDSLQIPATAPRFEIVANPQLENSAFDNGTNWTTEGEVSFANHAATLTETATAQTRLNQVFVLGEHDRFLSFTLKSDLQANAGPSDAFEVALLDANTGLSLMGATGLTHNDAILNLQANGTEHKGTGITRVDNPDGSHTYLVDLAGIPAGTTVNLAFDLIGFGLGAEAANNQITVRDLRLGVPQTTDDSATLAEDTPTVIDAVANDLNARHPGFIPVVVSGLAHGQVVVNTPSTGSGQASFSFTPEKWYQ